MIQIKIQNQKEIHLYRGNNNYESILKYIQTSFKRLPQDFSLTYLDQENDSITVSSNQDLQIFLEDYSSNKVPKLQIVDNKEEQSQDSKQRCPFKDILKELKENSGNLQDLFKNFTTNMPCFQQFQEQGQQQQKCPLFQNGGQFEKVFENLPNLFGDFMNCGQQQQQQQSQNHQQQFEKAFENLPNLFGAFMGCGKKEQEQQQQQNEQQFDNFMDEDEELRRAIAESLKEMEIGEEQQQQTQKEDIDDQFDFVEEQKVLKKEFSQDCYERAAQVQSIIGGYLEDYLGICDTWKDRDIEYIVNRLIIDENLVKTISSYQN